MELDALYDELKRFMRSSGKRIKEKAGKISDIGVKKQWLTEEDLAIERGFKELIAMHRPQDAFYAEEENDFIPSASSVWVADPISGTRTFIQGLPGYAIVIAHLIDGFVQFGAVYDPVADELFTAQKGKGAFLNGKEMRLSEAAGERATIILNRSSQWKDLAVEAAVLRQLQPFDIQTTKNSHALNICHVAAGKYDGNVSLTKDSFPMFAAAVILQESGGEFMTFSGRQIVFSDREFLGGKKTVVHRLRQALTGL